MRPEKINCKELRERLAALFDAELEEATKQVVLSHLAEYPACSAEKEVLEKVWREIGFLPEAEVPAHIREKTLGRAASHIVFGVVYAFLPFFLAFLIHGRKLKEDLLRQAIAAGAFFVFLLLPSIYLQAWQLSIGVFLSRAIGSAFESFMGGLTGASVYRPGFWRYAPGA